MDNAVNEIVTAYAKRVYDEFKSKAIYLLGSYARGNQTSHSDIDVAVVFNDVPNDKYMAIYGKLWEVAGQFDGRIEPKLLIDDGVEDRFSMLYEVARTGQMIH